ncbi:MAG TPA: EAL domain-containing protein [Acidobacteriaceae bacterium]|nr:EAL domain-containing protein [Acidobacteriaceae bacterium]
MAQLVEFFGDSRIENTPPLLRGDLPQQLDRLLLTSRSVSELYSRLGEFLLQIVAVDGMWLGSPDEHGRVQYHHSAGDGVAEFLGTEAILIDENANSPLAHAWRTGTPEFACDWTDPRSHLPGEFWRERGLRFGWKSSCAIPIAGESGKRDIFILYSKRPKFFGRDYIRRFVLQLHSLLGFALERLRLLEAVQNSQQALKLYKSAMDVSTHGILIAAAEKDLPICYVNPAFERITGYSAEEAIGRNCRFLQGADTAQPQMKTIREALSQGKSCTVELRNYRKNGTMFWNSISIAPVVDETGCTTHFIGVQKDVTDVKALLRESIHSNALYRALMSTAELVISARTEPELLDGLCHLLIDSKLFSKAWIGRPNLDDELQIESICNAGGKSNPVSCLPNVNNGDEAIELTMRAWRLCQLQFMNDRKTGVTTRHTQDSVRKDPPSSIAVVPLYRGGEIWALLTLLSNEPDVFSHELRELMERIGRLAGHGLDALDLRHALEEEHKVQSWLARHDALTDLLNRRGLTERVEEAIARSRQDHRSMAVAFMSLNGFQSLNELHGRPVCDRLLHTVAQRLRDCLKPSDSAGRLDGDDFVLVLEALEEDDLTATLSEIQAAVEGLIDLSNGHTTTIQTSLGVTLFPHDNSTAQHLLRHADQALCAFKESRGTATARWTIFQPETDTKKRNRQTSVLALFHKGNVRVHYQPLVDLHTGSVRGVEALARLVDNTGKILLPGEFLDCFRPHELTELTLQVLARALQDLRQLDRSNFHLNLGINLEPATLADVKAMQNLRHQIETSELSTNRIVLELLEHPDTLSLAGSREVLLDLKRSGARVALDDIGSGYSSLLRIKELPVDGIKLDRSFLNGLDDRPRELRFLMHLMDLSQTLGVDLIAEGIETVSCLDAVAALGIKLAQGYVIATPMNIEELEQWLRHYQPTPWTGPTTPLGAVALQLRELSVVGRILDQNPSLLHQASFFESKCSCVIGDGFRAIGPNAAKLFSSHTEWHMAMAALWQRSMGSVDPGTFQAARAGYEEQLFELVLESRVEPYGSVRSS